MRSRRVNLLAALVIVAAIVGVMFVVILRSGGDEGPSGLGASFTYSPTSPAHGATVSFTDNSTVGNIASWSWDFSDGSTSADQNPTHLFTKGTYTVTLTITASGGQTYTCSQQIIIGENQPSETIPVYTDAGFLPESGLMTSVYFWPTETWGVAILRCAPNPIGETTNIDGIPEGVKCFHVKNGPEPNTYAGWGVFIGVDSSTDEIDPSAIHIIDISECDNLTFYVRTPVNLHVELQDWNTTTDNKGVKSNQLWIGNYGWVNTGGWEKITIPKSEFRNVDFSKIWCPFMISTPSGQPNVEWYVDWVQWEVG